MYLIDTNIVSEVRKRERCNPQVAAWWATVADTDLFLSVLVLGEIRQGIERVRGRDQAQAEAIDVWLQTLTTTFSGRLLSIDATITDVWGGIAAKRTTPVIDGLLAATAIVHDLTLATRNVDDIRHCGARFINPFQHN
jgi:toxin FitB